MSAIKLKLLSNAHAANAAAKARRARTEKLSSGPSVIRGSAMVRCPRAGEAYEFRYAKSGGWQFSGSYYCPATNCPHCGVPVGAVVAADGELAHIVTTGSFVHTIESRIVEKAVAESQRQIEDRGSSVPVPAMGM